MTSVLKNVMTFLFTWFMMLGYRALMTIGDCNLAENIVYLNDDNNHDGWEFVDRGRSRKKIDLGDVEDQYLLKEIYGGLWHGKRFI